MTTLIGGPQLYLRQTSLAIQPQGSTQSLVETGVRIKFHIEQSNQSTPNDAKLEIYNLALTTRTLLQKPHSRIIFSAGYQNTISTILVGEITKSVDKRETVDTITKIEVHDGDNSYTNATFDKGYPPGITPMAVINDLASNFNLGIGLIQGVPTVKLLGGMSLSGPIRNHLDTICNKFNLQWSIQNEVLQIIPNGKGTNEDAIYISSGTGLIGSPGRTATGIEFTSLLQPHLRPGRKIVMDSLDIQGTFILLKVTQVGDNYQGEFVSKCEAIPA